MAVEGFIPQSTTYDKVYIVPLGTDTAGTPKVLSAPWGSDEEIEQDDPKKIEDFIKAGVNVLELGCISDVTDFPLFTKPVTSFKCQTSGLVFKEVGSPDLGNWTPTVAYDSREDSDQRLLSDIARVGKKVKMIYVINDRPTATAPDIGYPTTYTFDAVISGVTKGGAVDTIATYNCVYEIASMPVETRAMIVSNPTP